MAGQRAGAPPRRDRGRYGGREEAKGSTTVARISRIAFAWCTSRNLLGLVGAGKRQDLATGLRSVFAATTREQALASAQHLAEAWRGSHPKVARALEEELEDCLACLAFPVAHQPRIRTTNGLERLNQELKRRTRVVRIYPNRDACLRLVSALCMEQSEEWLSGRRYLDLADLPAGTGEGQLRAG